jgi:DNA-binding NarL/FixJ family response regulator
MSEKASDTSLPGRSGGTILVAMPPEAQQSTGISRVLAERSWRTDCVATAGAALRSLARPLGGLIVDSGIGDGATRDVIHAARERRPSMPILVVVDCYDEDAGRRCRELRALACSRGRLVENAAGFTEQCRIWFATTPAGHVEALADSVHLPPTPLLVVRTAVVSCRQKFIAEQLRREPETIASHIKMIRERTGAASLEDLVIPIRMCMMR